ncbi:MAG: AbrB/MazE/SpoVT family DNA-binding domain-containing protein [Acidobacteriaceae bacterium]|nr:AbrB/MazE/SpoVT family DNA-binding domain-containing protein [Acidobacteriaceae bacterium]
MRQKAKVFTNGRSQAIRIPKEFRFSVSEVFIRRDPSTGDVILSTENTEPSWDQFFQALKEVPEEEREDFAVSRNLIEAKRGDLL